MKKSMILFSALLLASVCNAQTLDEIVNKYYAANGIEVFEKANTLRMEATMSQMGMELPMIITARKPDKLRSVVTFSGLEIITTFDGEKGYTVNPLAGITEPTELPEDQLSSIKDSNPFRDNLMDSFKGGRLKLEGEEDVDGKPAYKLIITDEAGKPSTVFVDKSTFLTVKMVAMVEQMGQEMEVESFIKEWMDVNGAKFGKVVTQMVNGTEAGSMTINKVEFDIEVDDSIFTLK